MKPDKQAEIFIDFETYYSTECSLSKITTQSYLRDEKFEVIGAAIAVGDERPVWIPGQAEVGRYLETLDLESALVVAQNAQFDGPILEWIYGRKPDHYWCTMMGARPHMIRKVKGARMSLAKLSEVYLPELGAKGGYVVNARGKRFCDFTSQELAFYGAYCVQDTALCRGLYRLQKGTLAPAQERALDATIKKFTRPQVRLNRTVLHNHLEEVITNKAVLLLKAGVNDPKELRSDAKFADLLVEAGVHQTNLPMKTSPATGKLAFAFAKSDQGLKALAEHDNPLVRALVAARLGHKTSIEESRTKRLLDIANLGGLFSIPQLYYGAHTGRYSGSGKINIQNLGRGSQMRAAIEAPPGYKLVVGDLSQIEARMTAWLAGQGDLVRQFAEGRDVYVEFATVLYEKPASAVTKSERFIAKMAILGLGYGMGAATFYEALRAAGVGLPLEEVQAIVDKYRSRYVHIKTLWRYAGYTILPTILGNKPPIRYGPLVITEGFIGLPNGMSLHYDDAVIIDGEVFYGPEGKRRRIFGPKLVENLSQALANIVLGRAEDYLLAKGHRAAFSVHDELAYVVPEKIAEKFAVVLKRVLTRDVPWALGLPLAAEVAIGDNYLEAK